MFCVTANIGACMCYFHIHILYSQASVCYSHLTIDIHYFLLFNVTKTMFGMEVCAFCILGSKMKSRWGSYVS